MKKLSRIMSLMLVMACVCALIVPASAADVVKVIDAEEFGTLTGILYDSYADISYSVEGHEVFFYTFGFETRVERSPADWATIHVHVELYNQATGEYLGRGETGPVLCANGNLTNSYYYELDTFSAVRGTNGITVSVFGCHEVRYYDSYVAYTKKTYNLQRDHGII